MKRYLLYGALALLTLIIAGAAGLYLYLPKIARQFSAGYLNKYDIDFRVEQVSVSLLLPPGITLNRVSAVQGNSSFMAEKAFIGLNLVKLLKTRNIAESFNKIMLVNPELTVDSVESLTLPVNTGSRDSVSPEISVDWKNARIALLKKGLRVYSDSGRIVLSKAMDSVEAGASVPSYGDIKMKFVSNKNKNKWNLKIENSGFKTPAAFSNKKGASSEFSIYTEGVLGAGKNSRGRLKFTVKTRNNARVSGQGTFTLSGLDQNPYFYSRIAQLSFSNNDSIFTGSAEIIFSSNTLNVT